MKEYVIKNEEGLYIGIDEASGGYPFETKNLGSSFIWRDKQEAENYIGIFSNLFWTLHEITTNQVL